MPSQQELSPRDGLMFQAKLAEESERYEDMTVFLANVIKLGEGLDSHERNMLSIAFKNRIGALRHSIRIVSSIQESVANNPQKYGDQWNGVDLDKIKNYNVKMNQELKAIADEVLELLRVYLIDSDFEKIKAKCQNNSGSEEAREVIERELFYGML